MSLSQHHFLIPGVVFINFMQNRYVADVGDFGKFALLNALCDTDLQLGVMWYLNSAEESNADGRFTNYADLKSCDPTLYGILFQILQTSTRKLSEIESKPILPPGTLFYSAPLPSPNRTCFATADREKQRELRREWFETGFRKLQTANLLFLDPDNGVAGRNVKKYSRRSIKYVFLDEIESCLQRQQSVVVYQHQRRVLLQTQIREQLQDFGALGLPGWSVSFHRQSVRIYFVLPASERHRALLLKRTETFCASKWGKEGHFKFSARNSA